MDVEAFYDLTPRQFNNKTLGFNAHSEFLQDQEWQRARIISFFALKVGDTKNKIKTPQALFKLQSDTKEKEETAPMTNAKALELANKWK